MHKPTIALCSRDTQRGADGPTETHTDISVAYCIATCALLRSVCLCHLLLSLLLLLCPSRSVQQWSHTELSGHRLAPSFD